MRHRRNFSRQNRAAFTLMELLLVMSILVIMGGMVTFAFLNIGQNTTMDLTQTQINTIEQACIQFRLKHQRFPNTLDELTTPPSGMTPRKWGGPFLEEAVPLDPWGGTYAYSRDERNNLVTIRSAGPDGQMNTEDDIPDPAG